MVTSIVGTVALGLALIAAGLAPAGAFWLAVGAWLLFGLALPVATGPLQALYQAVVPAEVQGRFFALNTSALALATPLALALGGPLADRVGVRSLFLVGGVATLAVALVRALSRSVRALDKVAAQGLRPAG